MCADLYSAATPTRQPDSQGVGGGLSCPGGEGRDSHVKGVGILVISLRDVNYGF